MSPFYGAATITVYLFAMSDRVTSLSDYILCGFVSIRYWSHTDTWLLPLLPLAVLVEPLAKATIVAFFLWRQVRRSGGGLCFFHPHAEQCWGSPLVFFKPRC
jgi:hypothetical protein